MIVRKILEYTEECTTEKYILIADKYDEGWELDREEMHKLVDIIERSLEAEKKSMFSSGAMHFTGGKAEINRELLNDISGLSVLSPYSHKPIEEDQAEECPDKIEPPEETHIVSKSMWLDIQVPEDTTENVPTPKATRQEERDFSAYAKMYAKNADRGTITREMVKDWGITESTATSYYYSKVKPEGDLLIAKGHEREVEREKKSLAAHLEKKMEVIPPKKHDKPSGQKYFSDEDRERIQKQVGLK